MTFIVIKNNIMKTSYLNLFIIVLIFLGACSQDKPKTTGPVIVAYVTTRGDIPDPTYITHINYAFGHVNEDFNGIIINRPPRPNVNNQNNPNINNTPQMTSEDRLRAIVELKKQKTSLKVLLSIGGWGSGGFSEMAGDINNRKAFVADCKRVVDEFKLDGIDLDWEYPTSSAARISSSPEDKDNFTSLMREIREILGKNKLLTFASASNAEYVDFKAVDPYLDFVNIMTYDIATPPYHHAGLYRSEHTRGLSVEESVDLHIAAGIAPNKLTLGMPFYGKGLQGINIHDLSNHPEYTEQWDDVAKAPYLTNEAGEFVFTYENPRSIALKCEFILNKGLLGAMYWQYGGDDSVGTYRKTVYDGVMKKTP